MMIFSSSSFLSSSSSFLFFVGWPEQRALCREIWGVLLCSREGGSSMLTRLSLPLMHSLSLSLCGKVEEEGEEGNKGLCMCQKILQLPHSLSLVFPPLFSSLPLMRARMERRRSKYIHMATSAKFRRGRRAKGKTRKKEKTCGTYPRYDQKSSDQTKEKRTRSLAPPSAMIYCGTSVGCDLAKKRGSAATFLGWDVVSSSLSLSLSLLVE